MKKIASKKGDASALENLAGRGHPLAKSFAAALMVHAEGGAPYLASMKTPNGNIQYAMRGKVAPEYLIGVQHFTDATLRLLAYRKEVQRAGGWLYSLKDTMYYSKKPDAADYVSHWELDKKKSCKCEIGPFVNLKWVSADLESFVCQKCGLEDSTLARLTSNIVARNLQSDFEIEGGMAFKNPHGEVERLAVDIPSSTISAYFYGQIGDKALLQRIRENSDTAFKDDQNNVFVVGTTNYGNNAERFIDALSPTNEERLIIEALLEDERKTFVLEEPKVSEILAKFSDKQFEKALFKLSEDGSLIKRAIDEAGAENRTVAIRQLVSLERRHQVDASLPVFENIGPNGSFVDTVVRVARSGDMESARRMAEQEIPASPKGKTLACSLLTALDGMEAKGWMFNDLERESGGYLKKYVERMMEANGEEYREALQQFLTLSGSGEELP